MTSSLFLNRLPLVGTIFFSFIAVAFAETEQTGGQRAGGVEAGQKRFRLIRSVSGSRGHVEGTKYVVEDPRTIFRIPDDQRVIVYLEWEGPPGPHEFEGLWKNPDDKVVGVSDFRFEAKDKRFGGYFTLLLTEASRTGIWTLEARVDGETTGQHIFQIVSAQSPAAQITPSPAEQSPEEPRPEAARQPLAAAELYQSANAATVLVEKLNDRGVAFDSGSGFFVDPDIVLTAFQVIDGANKLRLSLPDGRRLETQQVLTWDKWQDWAFIKVNPGNTQFIRFSPSVDWSIGNRVYTLSVSPAGARVIVRCDIVGKNKFTQNGERISLHCTHPDTTGSPLLNEYGELIGVVGGSLTPGLISTKALRGVYYSFVDTAQGLLAVPINSFSKPSSTQPSTPLQQLGSDGTFLPALARSENLLYGTLARRVETKPYPTAIDETYEFRAGEKLFAVFLTWEPRERIKETAVMRIYDLSGRMLGETKPMKIDLKPGTTRAYSSWRADISNFKPAVYRVDVFLGSSPVWRAFFRVRD
jgi:S1-C subfamily serine protease